MRKSFLLFASMIVALGADAQLATRSMVRNDLKPLKLENPVQRTRPDAGTANKGTGQTRRMYNYVNHLATVINPDILTEPDFVNNPYMWDRYNGKAVYQGTSSLVLDTIDLGSYGFVLHPWFAGYNNDAAYPGGTMAMRNTNAYTVDSIITYGAYGRNRSNTTSVDTLRFVYTYANGSSTSNILSYYYTQNIMSQYGVDTAFAFVMDYNPATRTMMRQPGSSGPAVVVKDVYLKAADTAKQAFGIAAGLSVPAGNLTGVSITFITGDNFTPYDTVFSGSATPGRPFKHGMFRPNIFVEKTDLSLFPTYSKNNYNSGQFQIQYLSTSDYIPNWALYGSSPSQASPSQFPDVDFVISCPTCASLDVKNVNVAKLGNAYPNPANATITLPITMKESANVNVMVSNMLGQSMASQNMGQINANQTKNATFSTANLANGVYFMTVEASGARSTARFVVAH